MNKVGQLIKNKIKENFASRVEAAKVMGVTEGGIRRWEKVGLEKTKISNIKKLSTYLNIDLCILMNISECTEEDIKLAKKINKLEEPYKKIIINNINELKDYEENKKRL